MHLSEIRPQMRVAYVPHYLQSLDASHPDAEHGTVSSVNFSFAFVKFDRQVAKLGWEGTTSQSCKAEDLFLL